MHSRKRSAAFLSDDTSNDTLSFTNGTIDEPNNTEQDTPSKRLQNNRGASVPQIKPLLRYNAQRLLNNLAFTRLYVTANFHAWDPASSPVILCCVDGQCELCFALCQILPSLYDICPNLQALSVTSGYLNPNAMTDQALARVLPLTTTAGLDGTVADEFDVFRQDLGPGDCIALVSASGQCIWTSREATSIQDMEQGLRIALTSCVDHGGGRDVAMPDG